MTQRTEDIAYKIVHQGKMVPYYALEYPSNPLLKKAIKHASDNKFHGISFYDKGTVKFVQDPKTAGSLLDVVWSHGTIQLIQEIEDLIMSIDEDLDSHVIEGTIRNDKGEFFFSMAFHNPGHTLSLVAREAIGEPYSKRGTLPPFIVSSNISST